MSSTPALGSGEGVVRASSSPSLNGMMGCPVASLSISQEKALQTLSLSPGRHKSGPIPIPIPALQTFPAGLRSSLVTSNGTSTPRTPKSPFGPRIGGSYSGLDIALEEQYEVVEFLGRGHYSDVWLCKEKATGTKHAIKVTHKSGFLQEDKEKRLKYIQNEIDILRRIKHKNIVTLYNTVETPEKCYLVLEYLAGGELFEKIAELSHFSEIKASKIIKQVLEAVCHLHSNNIVHRDLKPENLLLDSEMGTGIKLTDFGLAFVAPPGEEPLMDEAVGTPGFMAPEVLELLETGAPYGKEVDLWSVGVILYILLCGFSPFFGEDDEEIFEQVKSGKFYFPSPYWDDVSDAAKALVENFLERDPTKRITAEQALKDPWIEGTDQLKVNLPSAISQLKIFNVLQKLKSSSDASSEEWLCD